MWNLFFHCTNPVCVSVYLLQYVSLHKQGIIYNNNNNFQVNLLKRVNAYFFMTIFVKYKYDISLTECLDLVYCSYLFVNQIWHILPQIYIHIWNLKLFVLYSLDKLRWILLCVFLEIYKTKLYLLWKKSMHQCY